MKKIFTPYIIAGAAALLALISCDNEEEKTVEPETGTNDSYYAAQATVNSSDTNFTSSDEGGSIRFKAMGGTVTIDIDCGCSWDAFNQATDFLSTTTSETTLTVSAMKSTVERERTGTITLRTASEGITFATVTVTQDAYDGPEIVISTNEWNAPAKGTLTTEISVEASDDWTAESADSWLTFEQTATGIILTVAENGDTTERSSEITITCDDDRKVAYESIMVNQDAKSYVTLSVPAATFYTTAGTVTVDVESNYDWSYEQSGDWFAVSRSGDRLTLTADENTGDSQSGTLTITAGDGAENVAETQLTVAQAGKNSMILTYLITSSKATLPLAGTVNCTVNWGDGTIEKVTSDHPTHSYTEAGEHTLVIDGTVTSLCCENYTNFNTSLPISAVIQWGETGLTNMYKAFYYCKVLTSLPETTGDAFAKVEDFSYAFAHCQSLAKIPSDFFANCPLATTLAYALNDTDITEIPVGLLDNCTSVTNFATLFADNTGITEIPKGLFDNCTSATSFGYIFSDTGITEVPAGLFDNCTSVTNFRYVFSNCPSLKTVPAGLFDKCTSVTNFSYAFQKCTNLTGESPYTTIEGEKVHLYERADHPDVFTAPTTTTKCFLNCTCLDDYDSIPDDWK